MLAKSSESTSNNKLTQQVNNKNVVQVVQALVARQLRSEEAQVQFYKYQTQLNTLTQAKTDKLLLAQRKLENQILAGRAAMASLHSQLEREGGRIDTLQTEVTRAEEELQRVNSNLSKLEQVVQDQSALLSAQGRDLNKLASSNRQREALVELFILFLCSLVARTIPMQTLLFVLPVGKNIKSKTSALARIAVFFLVMRKAREHASTLGWTSGTDLNLLDHLIRLQQ